MTAAAQLKEVTHVADGLKGIGLEPVLVGGMALVLLGSRRITRDFDLVIPQPGDRLNALVDLLYDRGFELASKVNDAGDITATIDNPRVAAVRLQLDGPASAYFWHPAKRLRIDLLFDFPVAAAELAANAVETKIRGRVLNVASAEDLLRLKEIAAKQRSAAGDTQDIEFLKAHLSSSKV
ncbi:MAG TPA: hypothetical protein VJ691_14585 [Vicinamibacterales bacterium]|nr:hypothetical protein [Vicinamibacterales bacterium]